MGIVIGCVNAGVFLVLSLFHIFDCRSIKPKNTVFHQAIYLADVIFDRALLRELKTSRVGCASTCHIHPKCRSYFYNKADHVCRTHSTIFTDNTGSIPATGWHYYGRHAASVKRKLVPAKQMQTIGPVTTPSPGLSSFFKFAQNATTPLPVTDITDDDNDNDNDYQEGSDDNVTTDPARGGTTESPPEVTSSYLVTDTPGRTGETKTPATDDVPEGRNTDFKEKDISTPSIPEDDRETTKGLKVAAVDLDVSTSTLDTGRQSTVGEINPSKPTDGVDTVTVHPKDVERKGVTTLANNVDQKTDRHELETIDSSDIRESETTGMDGIQESQTTDSMDIQESERTNPSDIHEPGVVSTNGKTISDRTGVVTTLDVSSTTEGTLTRSAPMEHALPTGVDKTTASIHSHTSVPHDEDFHDELSFLTTQEQNAIIELAIGVTASGTTLSWDDDGDGSEGLTVVVTVGDDEETRSPITTFTVDPSIDSSIRMIVTDAGIYSDDDDDDLNTDNDVDEDINLFDDLPATMDLTSMMTTTIELPPERNDAGHVTKSPSYDLTKEQSVFDKILHKPTERPPYSSEPVAVRVVAGVVVVVVVCLAGSGVYAWYVRRRTGSFNILKKSEDGLGLQLITST